MNPAIRIALSTSALAAFFLLPTGAPVWFDGPPWSNPLETVLLTAAFPFLFFVGRAFLALPGTVMGSLILLGCKIILTIASPQGGLGVRVYANEASMEEGRWEKTYLTLWKGGCSDILKRGYRTKRDFPIEWMNRYPSRDGREERLWMEVSGYVVLPPDTRFRILSGGLIGGEWRISQKEGKQFVLPFSAPQGKGSVVHSLGTNGAVFRLSGRLHFGPGEWSFIPYLEGKKGGNLFEVPFGVLWQDAEGPGISRGKTALLKGLALMNDGGVCLFFGCWLLFWISLRFRSGLLGTFPVLLGVVGCFLPWLFHRIFFPAVNDPTLRIYLAMSLFLLSAVLILWSSVKEASLKKEGAQCTRLFLGVVGPGVLVFCFLQWWPDMGRMSFLSLGDDWRTYQNFAREIFVGGDIWHRQEPVFAYQPLYRYVVGLLHLFFGQSMIAQNFLDVWSVLIGGGILLSLSYKLTDSLPIAFLAPWIYLTLEWGGAFRHHIGRGLQEHTAMLFMMLTIGWLFQRGSLSWKRAATGGLLAALGFYLRMDHLGVLAAAGTVWIQHPPGSFSKVWKAWWKALFCHKGPFMVFGGMLLAALLSIPLRNGIIGGKWVFNSVGNLNILRCYSWSCSLENLRKLLFASDPSLPFTSTPVSWATASVLFPGTVIALMALFVRKGPLTYFPLSLGILLTGLIAPYIWVKVVAYPPRFSIHLLPLAVLSMTVALHHALSYLNLRLRNKPLRP